MRSTIYKISLAILALTLVVISSLFLLRPINDPDFFWHLKTGEWIWQHKGVPAEDPFSFTTQGIHTKRARLIMSAYWLSNLLSYFSYSVGGMDGIIVLRFFIAAVFIGILLLLKEGDPLVYGSVLLISVVFFFSIYPFDRPQIFSFIFFALLMFLLRRITADSAEDIGSRGMMLSPAHAAYALPVVMLLWANMHRGFIAGQMLILLTLVSEGIKFKLPFLKPISRSAYRKLLPAGLAAVAFAFLNPNSYYPLLDPFYFQSANNIEYLSFLQYAGRFYNPVFAIYVFLLITTVIGLCFNLKKTGLATVVILAGTGIVSFLQVRYIAFFLIAAIPFVSAFISDRLGRIRYVVLPAAVVFALFFSSGEAANINYMRAGAWINNYLFPVKAAEFITRADIKGNMYNHFNFGGYLLWRLAPGRKVFIDGRELDMDVYNRSFAIITANNGENSSSPLWKSLMTTYDISYVVLPLFEPSGRVPQLVATLLGDREWVPVFFSMNSMVLVKDSPDNYHVIRKYSVPREYFIEDLIGVCDKMIAGNPSNIAAYIAKGDIYRFTGRRERAREEYEKVLRIVPLNSPARERLRLLTP